MLINLFISFVTGFEKSRNYPFSCELNLCTLFQKWELLCFHRWNNLNIWPERNLMAGLFLILCVKT